MAEKTGYIGRNPGDSSVTIARQTYTPTSNTTEFSFTSGYTVGLCDVYLNGVKLIDARDYDANTGSTVGLTSAAVSGDIVEIIAYKAFNLGNVTDASGNFTVGSNVSVGSSVTAVSYYGDGSNLTGLANTAYIDAASLTVAGIATFNGVGNFDAEVTAAGGVDVTGGVKSAGIVSVTNTTASTSSATGALIVSGGVGIAGSLHVGENVSIGGTLTYEDVTNIDSVGLITAKSGVNITGGEFRAGIAVTIGAAGITTFSKGVHLDGPTVIGKGNSLQLENGFENENALISNDGSTEKATIVFKTSSGGTVSERLRIKDTGDVDLSGSAAGVSSVTWDASANSLIWKDNSKAVFGDGSDLTLYHDGTNSAIQNATGNLYVYGGTNNVYIRPVNGEDSIIAKPNSGVDIYYDNSKKFQTTNDGAITTGIATASDFVIGAGGTSVHTALGTKASTGKAIAMAMVFG